MNLSNDKVTKIIECCMDYGTEEISDIEYLDKEEINYARDRAIDALNKEEICNRIIEKNKKYEWHDCLYNPEDIPEYGTECLCIGYWGGVFIAKLAKGPYGRNYFEHAGQRKNAAMWRYIDFPQKMPKRRKMREEEE